MDVSKFTSFSFNTEIIFKDEQRESTHLDAHIMQRPQFSQNCDEDCWTSKNGNRKMLKAEFDADNAKLEEEYCKIEYNNSFGLEDSASLSNSDLQPENAFPCHINPQFDLQVLLQVSLNFKNP